MKKVYSKFSGWSFIPTDDSEEFVSMLLELKSLGLVKTRKKHKKTKNKLVRLFLKNFKKPYQGFVLKYKPTKPKRRKSNKLSKFATNEDLKKRGLVPLKSIAR